MLYFLTAFIVFLIFLLFQRDKRPSVNYLMGVLLFYALAIIFMVLYLSKDVSYYNILENYFLLPESVWKVFMFSSLSKNTIIRLMNAFSILTILMSFSYAITCMNRYTEHQKKTTLVILGILFVLEYLLYDPAVEKGLYLLLYPALLNIEQYHIFLNVTHTITMLFNNLLILISIGRLLFNSRQMHAFPYFKYYAYGEMFSYILIMISFLILFGQFPNHIIRFSRVSGFTTYTSLTLYSNTMLYTIFPYYLFFSSILMFLSIISLMRISNQMSQKDFSISGQIDAVNTSSKTFCHYMKNELLAIEAEMQLLEVPEESKKDLEHISQRCKNLYARLDKLHRSTKLSQLTMEYTDLETLIRAMLVRMAPELRDCQLSVKSIGQIPSAIVDPNYFEQAVHNIITNALDAMVDIPADQKTLSFTLRSIDNWIALSITDGGCGIPQEHISHIFDPFFTSQPIAKHWGIGMTMTYQIVKAHGGKISVESKEGKGTTFRILLPNLKKMLP